MQLQNIYTGTTKNTGTMVKTKGGILFPGVLLKIV